eukprot:73616-Amphidinium_carterae.1
MARPGATAARGSRRLDWFLASASLLPSLGWEEVTEYKPDHAAVAIEVIAHFTAPHYLGVGRAPAPTLEDAPDRFHLDLIEWERAREAQDVERLCKLHSTLRALE